MNTSQSRQLKTGGDPRCFKEYAALRHEMQKLSHPARPDVNWRLASDLCLTLFEQNGVELQTATWYTVSRAHLAGIDGMREGLAVLVALLTRQWPILWPQPVQTRIKLLASLSRRLQQYLRSQTLTLNDLTALNQVASLLNTAGDHLQRLDLRQSSQLDRLLDRIRNAVAALERGDVVQQNGAVANQHEHSALAVPMGGWVYVATAESTVSERRRLCRRAFFAGIGSALLVVATLSAACYSVRDPAFKRELLASVAPLSPLLDAASVQKLKERAPGWLNDDDWLNLTQQQLDELLAASPSWQLERGSALVLQANQLLPNGVDAAAMRTRWNQQLLAASLPAENMVGWQQGMDQLKALAQRLDEVDEKGGRYLTVSELKTAVYGISQALSHTVPVEEQLRQLKQLIDQNDDAAQGNVKQVEMHLNQLIASYHLLTLPQHQ